MKVLLLGKGGQVGWELQRSLAPLGELVALDFDSTELHADFSRPELLADVTAHAIRAVLREPAKSGLYHVVASGETSWHGYAKFVIETAQQAGVELKAGPDAVAPVPTTDFPTPAQRPMNSRLNTAKFQSTFGLTLPHWQTGVARMLREIL